MNHSITWADFYLICFAVGFCFSFFSFVFGGARTGRLHLPHFHGHVGSAHMPSTPPTAAHAPVAAHASVGTGAPAVHAAQQNGAISPFNFVTLTAFLAWFGGAGYLLSRYSGVWVGFGLLASITSGLVGGGIVFAFLNKVLISDYEMVGVLGRICSAIRAGGTGEMIYTQMGTRRVCGARSEDASAIGKGTEVVVTRYEKGIAYVRLFSELSGDE
jgi:hypothetical protein